MVSIEEIQAAYYLVAATGVLVAAGYYIMNLRVSQKNQELTLKAQQQSAETRQAQLFLQLYSQYYNREWVSALHKASYEIKFKDFDDFWKNYGPNNPEYFTSIDMMWHYFEGAGVLVKRGLLDPVILADLLSEELFDFWDKYSPVVMEFRKRVNNPHVCENQEYLYNLLKKMKSENAYARRDNIQANGF